jgi:L-asparaginase
MFLNWIPAFAGMTNQEKACRDASFRRKPESSAGEWQPSRKSTVLSTCKATNIAAKLHALVNQKGIVMPYRNHLFFPRIAFARLALAAILGLALLVSPCAAGTETDANTKPRPLVVILATGGTIAGEGASAERTTEYAAGVLDVNELIRSVPGLEAVARIRGEQVANIDSSHMTNDVLLKLAKRVTELSAEDAVAGVVVTHGTDTMEETAYFLNLLVPTPKPVVLTGSMRPATALSADGPLNLLNAVTVAASDAARHKGVLVVMNDEIHAARFVTKTHTTNVAAFQSPDFGALGHILDGQVDISGVSVKRDTLGTEIFAIRLTDLPRVDILYAHGQDSRDLVDAAVKAGARGIIHAGMGDGMVFPETYQALKEAAAKGVVVVRASRVGRGAVAPQSTDLADNMLASGSLNPQKARILLMLALAGRADMEEIRRIFFEF